MTELTGEWTRLRARKVAWDVIGDLGLDLQGLTVLTEAASGPYLYTPLLAALAGAKHVYAVTRDSRFATAASVVEQTQDEARTWGVADRVEVLTTKTPEALAAADIVTNSGFVRPIDRNAISVLKPTAVIPLMWETWEYRAADLDLDACREFGILVLGTAERTEALDMYPHSGFLAMKLLFDLGLEGHRTRVLLLGGRESLAGQMHRHLTRAGIEVQWFAANPPARPYDELPAFFEDAGASFDALIVAEHELDLPLVGPRGLLTIEAIERVNPALAIGVVAGSVDAESLLASSLRVVPRELEPFGYMSYQPYHLGPRPVLELYGAGLKVGEAMARARLAGLDLDAATAYALERSPAMPFPQAER